MVESKLEKPILAILHKKATTKVQYLLPSSCHPGHITKNIPYSLAYRLLRICSNNQTFRTRLEQLRHDLLSRSYKPKIIDDALKEKSYVKKHVQYVHKQEK